LQESNQILGGTSPNPKAENRTVGLKSSPTRKILKQEVSKPEDTSKDKHAHHALSRRSQTTVGNEDGFDYVLPVFTHDEE